MNANFVKTICIRLDMLTWLMAIPFVASVLIQVIAHPRNPFTYKLNGCCKPGEKISEWARIPGSASEGFY